MQNGKGQQQRTAARNGGPGVKLEGDRNGSGRLAGAGPGSQDRPDNGDGLSGARNDFVPAPIDVDGSALPESLYTVQWSGEDQKILEETLARYPNDKFTPLQRYVQVAALLPTKGVRDVALRVRWMTRKESGKRRKDDSREPKTKMVKRENEKEIRTGSIFNVGVGVDPDGLNGSLHNGHATAVGQQNALKRTTEILNQNDEIVNQVRTNLAESKVHENKNLLARLRDNITLVTTSMACVAGILSQMPPLPVKINQNLANSVLQAQQSRNGK